MIQPIVEGHGEEQAVPVLLRRLLTELGVYDVAVKRSLRCPKNQMTADEAAFKRMLTLARFDLDVSAVLFLFDADNDCARTFVPAMRRWADETAPGFPCAVVMARREYEAWFLAAITSLRGQRDIHVDATYPGDPEAVSDAKAALRAFMPPNRKYSETTDQAALSQLFDFGQACQGAASFRRLVQEVRRLLMATGHLPVVPPDWAAGAIGA